MPWICSSDQDFTCFSVSVGKARRMMRTVISSSWTGVALIERASMSFSIFEEGFDRGRNHRVLDAFDFEDEHGLR